jgi:hypothetical protein
MACIVANIRDLLRHFSDYKQNPKKTGYKRSSLGESAKTGAFLRSNGEELQFSALVPCLQVKVAASQSGRAQAAPELIAS